MSNVPTVEEAAEFVAALTALTDRYGIVVTACGCCDSPYLVKVQGGCGKYTYDPSHKGGGAELANNYGEAE